MSEQSRRRSFVSRSTWATRSAFVALGLAACAEQASDGENNLQSGANELTGEFSLFADTQAPKVASDPDSAAVEIGVRFKADKSGNVTGIRFYKGAGNGGTHVGHVWSSSGTLLATQTFTGETASGWQNVRLAKPLAITAGQTYIASYHTDQGHYAGDNGYFTGHGVDSGPLHAAADTAAAHNGVYRYGPAGFPNASYQASNYWVDLTFKPDPVATDAGTPPPPPPPPTTPPPPPPGSDAGSPSSQRNCAAKPSSCGYPDGTNTGVPAGTVLKRVPEDITVPDSTTGRGWHWENGYIRVDTPDAIVSNIKVNAGLYVINAPRTLIKNSYISCEGCYGGVQVRADAPASDDVTIQDTTLTAPNNQWIGVYNLGVKNLTMLRLDISRAGGGIQTSATGGWSLRDSYIHDLTQFSDQHMNGLQSSGGGNVTLIHNTIFNPYPFTDAVMLAVDPGGSKQVNDLVQNNLLAGGGYTVYGGATGSGCANPCTTSNIRFIDNRFSRIYFPNGGQYGPVAAFNSGDPGNVWSGNFWDDTGAPLNL